MAGRRPKPQARKDLAGNPGKRKPKQKEVAPSLDLGDAPEWLDSVAREEWLRVSPELVELGLLTKVDRTGLAAYCKAYSRWRQAEKFLDEAETTVMRSEKGYLQQLPQIAIAQKYLAIVHKWATEFGFTPSSRSRVTGAGGGKSDQEKDDDDFLGNANATKKKKATRRPHAHA